MTPTPNVLDDDEGVPSVASLPTAEEDILDGYRRLTGCYVADDAAEASFVPTKSFLRKDPLWRIDVLQDLMYDMERVRCHALVEWASDLANSVLAMDDEAARLQAFRNVCDELGIHIPPNLEALLVLSRIKAAGKCQ